MGCNDSAENIKIARKPHMRNIVLAAGVTRAGKSMLAPIISSLERAEIAQVNLLMEQFPMLNSFGQLSDDAAVYLMRYAADFMLYDAFIGRGVNFRCSDMSSIWRTRDPIVYFQRLYAEEGDAVYEKIEEIDPIQVLNVHYALRHLDIYLKAFPAMKIVHLRRNPFDVVFSWYRKGYGKDINEKYRTGILTIQRKGKLLPYYTYGWESIYEELPEMDRIIWSLSKIEDVHKEKVDALTDEDRKKVMIVKFEDVVTDPKPVVERIASFLGTKETIHTSIVLERERCPRKLSMEEREAKAGEIRKHASKDAYELLMSMSEKYNSKNEGDF